MQHYLLGMAESLLGPRDASKKIYQPDFHRNGPLLWNTPSLDGAFVQLSHNAANSWQAVVFEMAHETVHLLNPTVGYTNWLEEGVAVSFSLHALGHFGLPLQPINLLSYQEAHALVKTLPGGEFFVAKSVRESAGALNAVTANHLFSVFPNHDSVVLRKLASQCVPR
jgi:hypothetical protein